MVRKGCGRHGDGRVWPTHPQWRGQRSSQRSAVWDVIQLPWGSSGSPELLLRLAVPMTESPTSDPTVVPRVSVSLRRCGDPSLDVQGHLQKSPRPSLELPFAAPPLE